MIPPLERLQEILESQIGSTHAQAQLLQVSGGSISQSFIAKSPGGDAVFIKYHSAAPLDFFRAEAHGLALLRQANVCKIPETYAVGDDFLILVPQFTVTSSRKLTS